jgi:uncharacterized linocin/CFP29 family protein
VNHLLRELAPIGDHAWEEIEAEATRSITHFLAGRRLVDFDGPFGWEHSAVAVGRVEVSDDQPFSDVRSSRRRVMPLIELRAAFSLSRTEVDAAERGASDVDLDAVIGASRAIALAEDGMIFHGDPADGVEGMTAASPHDVVTIGDDYAHYPGYVANAVELLRVAGVGGPYAIALGPEPYTGVTETTDHGGYPIFEHLRQILGGSVLWAPAVDGAVVVSERGGDYQLTVGQDFSIGYSTADAESVELYLEESLAFTINTPEAAVHLAHG